MDSCLAVATIFAVITMFDATGVRRQAGELWCRLKSTRNRL
ncbi:divergent PAP2 family protein [Pseudomonas sp. TH10]